MPRLSSRLLVLLLACTFVAVANVKGETESGWTAIFDGTDINGWRYDKSVLQRKMETPDKRFSVKDGVLILAAKDKDGKKDKKSLVTIREFAKDFDLKLEFKAANEATGSVSVRSLVIPVGDFRRRNEYPALTKFKTDDWNELTVSVRTYGVVNGTQLAADDKLEVTYNGGKSTATLNGKPITAYPLSLTIGVSGSVQCNGQQFTGAGMTLKGPFSLNSNFGKIEFRNIRFKEVP